MQTMQWMQLYSQAFFNIQRAQKKRYHRLRFQGNGIIVFVLRFDSLRIAKTVYDVEDRYVSAEESR